jgi:ferredoxin
MMKKRFALIFLHLLLLLPGMSGFAQQQRFPKPEFESGYTQPMTSMPAPRAEFFGYLDVLVLVLSLSVITWFVLKKRSRKGVLAVSVFSILYFGFFREGCVCSVGSLQNVTLALFQPGYSIPFTALAFFVIPLVFTLFFGRTFCAGVCPLGALQDIFLFRPVTLKQWLQKVLGLIPFIYLGLALLYAATGTDFIICRYDPFIGIFRLDATLTMFLIGAAFLFISVFIARPYCRFFCPYGVLLNLVSRVSKKHLSITPSHCTQCRLCEPACPLGAIQKPVAVKSMENREKAVARFVRLGVILPLLVVLGGWTGSCFHENLSMVHPKVRLAQQLVLGSSEYGETISDEITAFRTSGTPLSQLYSEASSIVDNFYWGGWLLGGFLGLVFGLTLLRVSVFRYRKAYEPDKGACVSCARCLEYCPEPKNSIE